MPRFAQAEEIGPGLEPIGRYTSNKHTKKGAPSTYRASKSRCVDEIRGTGISSFSQMEMCNDVLSG